MSRRSFLGLVLMGVLATAAGMAPAAWAQAEPRTILVVGDSLGHDLGAILAQRLRSVPGVQVLNRGRASTSLVRADYYDWPAELERLLTQGRYAAVVVMIGMNDRQGIRHDRVDHPVFSEGWRRIYASRVERMMAALDRSGMTSFWMGLPSARNPGFSQGMHTITAIHREVAGRHRVRYVPIWDLTVNAAGQYLDHRPDAQGRMQAIRAADGMHLSVAGMTLVVTRLLETMDDPALAAATR